MHQPELPQATRGTEKEEEETAVSFPRASLAVCLGISARRMVHPVYLSAARLQRVSLRLQPQAVREPSSQDRFELTLEAFIPDPCSGLRTLLVEL